jgi:hypothetical protein
MGQCICGHVDCAIHKTGIFAGEKVLVSTPSYGEGTYRVSLDNYNDEWFIVGAYTEQEALDKVIDFCEEKGHKGCYWTQEEVDDFEMNEDYFVIAGNSCLYVNSEHLQIKKVGK